MFIKDMKHRDIKSRMRGSFITNTRLAAAMGISERTLARKLAKDRLLPEEERSIRLALDQLEYAERMKQIDN